MKPGKGFVLNSLFVVISFMIPLLKSISIISPSFMLFAASGFAITGSPMFIAFLKKILAKDSAIISFIPLAFIEMGACSLEEPHPKFSPAMMIFLFFYFSIKSLSRSSKQCRASSFSSLVFKYLAGIITSVSTLSPYFIALSFIINFPPLI